MINIDSGDRTLATVHPGHRIEAWDDRGRCCRGLAEEFLPHVGVVWIRKVGIGRRNMFTAHEHTLRGY